MGTIEIVDIDGVYKFSIHCRICNMFHLFSIIPTDEGHIVCPVCRKKL